MLKKLWQSGRIYKIIPINKNKIEFDNGFQNLFNMDRRFGYGIDHT